MKQKKTRSKETMSVSEMAAVLEISLAHAYRAAMKGELPVLRIGRRYVGLRKPFEAMLRGEGPRVAV